MTPDELMSAVPLPCAHLAPDGRITAQNALFETLIGANLVGRHYMTAFRQPALIAAIEAAMTAPGGGGAQGGGPGSGGGGSESGGQGGALPVRGRYMARSVGRDTPHDVVIAPIGEGRRVGGGQVGGWLLSFVDVSPLEEAGERRSEFVANVSHELRTPLTAILGFIETLRGPARDDTEARAHFLGIMEREARRMNRLVDDLLSLARVEDVERMRPMTAVDVAASLRSVVAGLAPRAEARAVTVEMTGCEAAMPAPGDSDQITQVFANLIENAIKYGREGGRVQVSLARLDEAPVLAEPCLRIVVSDDGEGIDERHLGRLTERFYRVDTHRSRGMGGTGLGLAIVKHIVNRHRGRLRIESEPGQGSRFSVFLPLK